MLINALIGIEEGISEADIAIPCYEIYDQVPAIKFFKDTLGGGFRYLVFKEPHYFVKQL